MIRLPIKKILKLQITVLGVTFTFSLWEDHQSRMPVLETYTGWIYLFRASVTVFTSRKATTIIGLYLSVATYHRLKLWLGFLGKNRDFTWLSREQKEAKNEREKESQEELAF